MMKLSCIKTYFYKFHKWGMVMDSVWIGKGMWNKVYKGEVLNNRDDSREVRKNKKNKKTELEKAIQIEKESKAPELKKQQK